MISILGFLIVLSVVQTTMARTRTQIVWGRKGKALVSERLGPGIGGVLGINQCTRSYCEERWHTVPSIAMTGTFTYRFIPNFGMFVDAHIGHLGAQARGLHRDGGVLFGATGGGEFHLPVGKWLDPYAGFGVGYALLGLYGERDDPVYVGVPDYNVRFHGLNLEMRFGVDFYFIKRAPTFSLGPQLRVGLPVWLKTCWQDGEAHDCSSPDRLEDPRHPHYYRHHDWPFLVHFGVAVKYGF
jgi:hypothetical protein